VTLQTETMRLKALMPDEKKVNEIILKRQLKYGNLPPPKAMSFPDVSNVSVPISTTSNKRTQTQKKRVPFVREPLKQLTQNGNEMYVNSNGRQGVFGSVNSKAPRQGFNSIHRQNNNQLNCNSDRNKNNYDFATQKTRKYGDYNQKEDFRKNHNNCDMNEGNFGISQGNFGNKKGGFENNQSGGFGINHSGFGMNQSNGFMHGRENYQEMNQGFNQWDNQNRYEPPRNFRQTVMVCNQTSRMRRNTTNCSLVFRLIITIPTLLHR
jgi:hypothetical protein